MIAILTGVSGILICISFMAGVVSIFHVVFGNLDFSLRKSSV
jgi:hypothetical protein